MWLGCSVFAAWMCGSYSWCGTCATMQAFLLLVPSTIFSPPFNRLLFGIPCSTVLYAAHFSSKGLNVEVRIKILSQLFFLLVLSVTFLLLVLGVFPLLLVAEVVQACNKQPS
ncbi:hypothetical protein, unlikely [Trypanosoma brucei brucei TREU927]|uniref:Uncharacterized protein n=1 Tax=Trypanosoma brucei brucei (strain 927/4 GUTat10.1) TaxID=185431 RepID=Q38E82_TRYB2|nr:hypothetical protein, unlikely [Trypanosoma brucei brucei TREU927]EAN76888.1 hypothetical protein, unlikely [Trypanosoma brucei brucei TREU927]